MFPQAPGHLSLHCVLVTMSNKQHRPPEPTGCSHLYLFPCLLSCYDGGYAWALEDQSLCEGTEWGPSPTHPSAIQKLCSDEYMLHSCPFAINHRQNSAWSDILLLPFLSVLWQNSLQGLTWLSLGPRTGFHLYYIIEATPEKVIEDAQDLCATTSRSPFSGLP